MAVSQALKNLNSLNDYSTAEKVVGRWTDGKPIYQKSFHYDTPITFNEYGSESSVFAKIPNINKIIDVKFMRTGSNFPASIFVTWIKSGTTDELCASYIKGAQATSYNPSISDITLQYTKTTD